MNIKNAIIKNVRVTGFAGSLLNIYNVTGTGLHGAGTIEAPAVPPPIPAPDKPYRLG